jgi:hypothetical protein
MDGELGRRGRWHLCLGLIRGSACDGRVRRKRVLNSGMSSSPWERLPSPGICVKFTKMKLTRCATAGGWQHSVAGWQTPVLWTFYGLFRRPLRVTIPIGLPTSIAPSHHRSMGTKSRESIYGSSIRHSSERAAEARKEADRLACVAWNRRMLGFQGPAQPSLRWRTPERRIRLS